ncbi:MAG: hypothetical protein ACRBB0_15170 [Pelagimonas sp.]|uniref:hypothetical protein n=1 Tax=Pelagimonas sp. TaxID=2073170 RepID=UPI003D6C1471
MPDTPPPSNPALICDWQEWLPYIEESDLGDDQKRQMIETLWSIVLGFVDLGWELHATSQETCGQNLDLKTALARDVVQLQNTGQDKEAL